MSVCDESVRERGRKDRESVRREEEDIVQGAGDGSF